MKIEITPVVVVPDMSPLIHVAAAGRLPLLDDFGRGVVMDIVAHEASDDLTKPWAREVAEWLRQGQEAGSNLPVEVVKTEIGKRIASHVRPTRNSKCRTRASAQSATGWLIPCRRSVGLPS